MFPIIFLSLTSVLAAIAKSNPPKISNTVFLIRHGEKPSDGGQGLTALGQQRAQCLVNVRYMDDHLVICTHLQRLKVFGPTSMFTIGYVLAQTPKSSGSRTRPLLTVMPVAQSLGITVDTSWYETFHRSQVLASDIKETLPYLVTEMMRNASPLMLPHLHPETILTIF